MFMKKIKNKIQVVLINLFFNCFYAFLEKKIIHKIEIKITESFFKLINVENLSDDDVKLLHEDKREALIGVKWFKYNQWLKDPILSECYAKVHWQLNGENYTRYTREYYREIEKRVYMMRPDLMKKYYSHNN